MEFPGDAHRLMLANFIENTTNNKKKLPKVRKFTDPKPSTKMKRMQMNQNNIVYKNWEDFNKYAAHPVAMVPSLFEGKEEGIAVEPFFNINGLF